MVDATDRSILVAMLSIEATATTIARTLSVARSTVNRHLPALDAAGLVRSRWDAQASRIGALVYRLTGKGRAIAEGLLQASLGLAGSGDDGVATDDGAGDVDATEVQG